MVSLAIASLEKMKGDDSRRISSLAERLLSEFEQTRSSGNKAMPAETPTVIEPKPVNAINDKLIAKTSASESQAATFQPEVEKPKTIVDASSASRKFSFQPSFWSKWIGLAI
jgi:hypothetical protein